MTLGDELARVAGSVGAAAVLAAEAHPGNRLYLCAFDEADGGRTWLALDGSGAPVSDRMQVREAVSILALCELAEETAGGGELDDLLSRLTALRITESPPGIEEAELAVRDLQLVLGAPPVLATPARLDEIGAATRRLEQALGGSARGSPFSAAMKAAGEVVEALWSDVSRSYRDPLR